MNIKSLKFFASVVLSCLVATEIWAMSAGVTPGSFRAGRTVQCIGNEANAVLFYVARDNFLPHHAPDLTEPAADLTLEIAWPQNVPVLGVVNMHQNGKFYVPQPVGQAGQMTIYRVVVEAKKVRNRLIANRYYLNIFWWFRAPKNVQTSFSWKLIYKNKILVQADNSLQTVGTIDKSRPLAKNYQLYICQAGADCARLPEKFRQERIDYYHRLGLNTIEQIFSPYHANTPAAKQMMQSGLELAALRGGGYAELQHKYYNAQNFGAAGLVGSMDKFCAELLGREAEIFRDHGLPNANCLAIDWEPVVRDTVRGGYDDAPTVAAFKKAHRITEELTPQLLKNKYREAYIKFRRQQLSRPILAFRQMLERERPGTKFFVEHGSGLPIVDLDYKDYDHVVDFHLPMIYTGSTLDFFQRTEAMTRYVKPEKLIPLTELTYSGNCNYRDVNGCVMNLLAPALAGCAGVGQWPGLPELDGGIQYAFYRTKVLLAPVENIFLRGKDVAGVLKPLPYQEKKLKIGTRYLDISYPQWSNSVVLRMREYRGNYAIGILNLNTKEDLFTQVQLKGLSGNWYLIEPDQGHYLAVSGAQLAQGVLFATPKHTPGIWLLTSRKPGTGKLLDAQDYVRLFAAKKAQLAAQANSTIELGKKGDLEVAFQELATSKGALPLLTVSNGREKLAWSSSGGRILRYELGNSGNLVDTDFNLGGLAMDMFWLPRTGRWSGDQVADMTLKSCTNDGKTVKITYTGAANKTLTGCRLTKVFTIQAEKPGVTVNVTLHNGNADPQNTFCYWSHNVMKQKHPQLRYVLYSPQGKLVPTGQRLMDISYPNARLTAEERSLLGGKVAQAVRPKFGLYDTSRQTGLIFDLPPNFLMNYRFNNCADIILKPVVVPHQGKLQVQFQISAYAGTYRDFTQQVKKESSND